MLSCALLRYSAAPLAITHQMPVESHLIPFGTNMFLDIAKCPLGRGGPITPFNSYCSNECFSFVALFRQFSLFLVHYLNFLTQDKVSTPKKRTGWCLLLQKEAMMLTSTNTYHLAISNTLAEVVLNASSSTYQQCGLEQVT